MTTLQPNDEFLVNRSDTTYTQEQGTLMANLETTDYLLINREDATYKITGEDLINSVIDPLEVTVVIAPNPPLIREDATAIPVVTGGKQPDGGYVFTYQWHYADDLLGTNKVDIPGQTAATYAVQESDIDKFIGCTCTTTDALGTTASGTGYAGPVSADEIAPVIDEVILTEIPNGNRYTDKEFPYTTVMTIDGTPDPTYALKARLSGTTFNFGVQSDTITKVEGAGEYVYTTDTIASVAGNVLSFPTNKDFDKFEVGDVVQAPDVKITNINADATPPTITVDGGSWKGTDGSGEQGNPDWYEPSQQWSSLWTYTTAPSGKGLESIFDGTGLATNYANFPNGQVVTWGGDVGSGRELGLTGANLTMTWSSTYGGTRVTIDNGTSVVLPNANSVLEVDIPLPNGVGNKVVFDSISSSGVAPRYFEVDGKLLVDSSVPGGPGDTNITKTAAYNTKLTVASDKDLDVITGDIYMTDGTPKQDGSGELEPASYTPVTNTIETVDTYTTYNVLDTSSISGFGTADTYVKDMVSIVNLNALTLPVEETITFGLKPTSGSQIQPLIFDVGTPRPHILVDVGRTNSRLYALYGSNTSNADWEFIKEVSGITSGVGISTDSTPYRYLAVYQSDEGTSKFTTGMTVSNYYLSVNFSSATTLTFEDTIAENPDLQYFREGDVVQGASVAPETIYKAYSSTTSLGNTATTSDFVYREEIQIGNKPTHISQVKSMLYEFDSPQSNLPFVRFDGEATNAVNAWTMRGSNTANGSDWVTIHTDVETFYGPGDTRGSSGNTPYKYIFISSKGLQGGGISFEKYGIDDTLLQSQVKVISTDLDANTMVVDGGEWLGSDGSGDQGWNQSQEWSQPPIYLDNGIADHTTGSGGTDITKVFNGLYPTGHRDCNLPVVGAGNYHTLDFGTTFSDATTVKIVGISNSTTPNLLRINGTGVSYTPAGDFVAEYTFDVTGTGLLSIDWGYFSIGHFFYVGSIYVDGRLLVDLGVAGAPDVATFVTGPTNTAEGTIASIDGTEVDLSASSGRWIADNKAGTNFSFVPTNAIIGTSNEAYGVLQIIGDKAQVTGIQASDPGFLNVTAKNYSIQFPSTFATGNAPDDDLPRGTSISAIVRAENEAGASVKESNILLPQVPNPLGSAGPITDVEGGGTDVYTTDTIASVDPTTDAPNVVLSFPTDSNFDKFEVGDVVQGLVAGTQYGLTNLGSGSTGTFPAPDPTSLSYYTTSLGQTADELIGIRALGYAAFFEDEVSPVFTRLKPGDGTDRVHWLCYWNGTAWIVDATVDGPLNGSSANSSLVGVHKSKYWIAFRSGANLSIGGVINVGEDINNNESSFLSDNFSFSATFDPAVIIIDIDADAVPPTITVDGGEWLGADGTSSFATRYEPSQEWSSLASGFTANTAGQGIDNSFDGNPQTYSLSKTGFNLENLNLTGVSTLIVNAKSGIDSSAQLSCRINADNNTRQSKTANGDYVFTFNPAGGNLNSIETFRDGNPYFGISSIVIDGKTLIDTSVTTDDLFDTELSKSLAYDSKLTVASPTNLDTFIADDSLVMVDDTGAVASYVPVTNTIESVETIEGNITGVNDSYTWSDSSNFERPVLTVGYPYTALFNGQSGVFYGNSSLTDPIGPTPGPIIWNAPAGANLSGNIFMTSGAGDGTYDSPVVYVNGSATPLTQIIKDDYGANFGLLCYVFAHIGPVNQIRIEPADANFNAIASSLGVGTTWLVDPGSTIDTTVCPNVAVTSNATLLTFEDTIAENPDLRYFREGDVVQGYDGGNFSQGWTTAPGTTISNGVPANAFDGDPATSVHAGYTNNSFAKSQFLFDNPISVKNKLELRLTYWNAANASADSAGGWGINDEGFRQDIFTMANNTQVPETKTVATGAMTLNSIELYYQRGGSALYQVIVDDAILLDSGLNTKVVSTSYPNSNTMVVDGGSWAGSDGSHTGIEPGWNQSQVWSANVVNDNDIYPAANAFDGNDSTFYYEGDTSKSSRVTFTTPLAFNSSVSILGASSNEQVCVVTDSGGVGGASRDVIVTGLPTNSGQIGEEIDITSQLVSPILGIGVNGRGVFTALIVDGLRLVDQTINSNLAPETVVTGPAKSGTGTFVSTNGTDTVSVSGSNYEWIANDNRLGEDFYIKKLFTALNANDPAHVAMQQAVADAFAAFPQNVSARRTSIASSLYRLMAGETLTAEEITALTETVTTAVNATEPFAYSGYYPLYYTAAAANAASSVGDHHTHDMDGQTFYMPDGGTIYHGTYIGEEDVSGY